jgi:hypothetical protein
MLQDGSPTKTRIALPTLRGESHRLSSRRSVSRPPFHARRCCALLGGVCGRRYAEYARTLQTPFSSATPEFYDCFFGLPPGTPAYTLGSGMGCEYPCEGTAGRSGLTPSAGPAVRRVGNTALMKAARNDDRATVAALLGARADVDTQSSLGCAFAVGAVRRGGRRWPTVTPMAAVPAPSGRQTALHYAAHNGFNSAGVELLVGGADQTITNNSG